jgi:hypothetical protein
MMIIKHGEYFENHHFICGCGCEWKASLSEIKYFETVEDDDGIYNGAMCNCPECGVQILEEDWKSEDNKIKGNENAR